MSNIRKTFNFRDGVQVDDEALVVKGDRVGVGTTSPDESLDIRGNAKVIGIITANNLEISGVSTFTCSSAHGLVIGSPFRIVDSSNNKLGDFTVKERVGVNTFSAKTDANLNGAFVLRIHKPV